MRDKLIDFITWVGVWTLYAIGFALVFLTHMVKDPAGIALLLFMVAALMLAYWTLTGFPEPWRALH